MFYILSENLEIFKYKEINGYNLKKDTLKQVVLFNLCQEFTEL